MQIENVTLKPTGIVMLAKLGSVLTLELAHHLIDVTSVTKSERKILEMDCREKGKPRQACAHLFRAILRMIDESQPK